MTNVGHDQRALTEAQLGSVTRSDPDTLDKSQHLDQPVHRRANIRIGEFGDHRTKRGRAIRSHHRKGTPRRFCRTGFGKPWHRKESTMEATL